MELISTHPIKESDLGFNRTLFGGKLLYWLDGDAVAYANTATHQGWLQFQ
jgi:acyl-CoA hydrolase